MSKEYNLDLPPVYKIHEHTKVNCNCGTNSLCKYIGSTDMYHQYQCIFCKCVYSFPNPTTVCVLVDEKVVATTTLDHPNCFEKASTIFPVQELNFV